LRLGTISLWGHDLEGFRRQVRLAEENGYEVVGLGDSPTAYHDLYVALAVAAQETHKATIGPMVTAPFIRHPAVTAGAISSIDDLSGGRAFLGLGTGGSLTKGIGRLAATQPEMREYLVAVRSLLAGQPVEWDGHQVQPIGVARRVPIYYSASGPRALALAGELADGAVLHVGSDVETVRGKVAAIREAAQAAGRNPDAVDIWGYSYCAVRPSRAEALDDVKAFLASAAAFGMRPVHAMATVPDHLKENVLELQRRYDVTQHTVPGGRNARLVDELGLADFIAGRTTIAGSPAEVHEQVEALAETGLTTLFCALPGNADPEGTLVRFAAAARGRTAAH
jgi:alkanesulfonate monooxygenase SsuD/methylene tetrahydromethanopterin reductase-like flavin-dependent oxidoreductase (luciferase family)